MPGVPFVPPVAVLISGLPGSGKSTLADLLARRIAAPSFAGDWLLGAMAPHGVLDDVPRPTVLGVYHDLLERLWTRQLMLGQSAVVDGILTDALVERWSVEASRHGGRLVVVECVCSDEDLHRERLLARRRDIPGWHEVGWDHVLAMRQEFAPLGAPDLVLDAVRPVEDNLRTLLDLLGRPDSDR